jgi:hypothetical protein
MKDVDNAALAMKAMSDYMRVEHNKVPVYGPVIKHFFSPMSAVVNRPHHN